MAAYPPELTPQPGCTLWRGMVSGKPPEHDPSVRVIVRLCPASGPGAVSGTLQWSSKLSGYNVRVVSGAWRDEHLELHDDAVTEEHPEPGWRFCAIDHYDLDRHGDELDGSYDSKACHDHSAVKLTRVADAPPPASAPEPPKSAQPADLAPPPAPTTSQPPPGKGPCGGCTLPGHADGPWPLAAAFALALAARRIARR